MRNNILNLQHLTIFIIELFFIFAITLSSSLAAEKQPVMGAGPSTVVAKHFFKHLSSLPITQDYNFIVEPRSIKHAGGIRASGQYLFGRTGRPLNRKEKQNSKHDLFIARIPLSFVVGKKAGVKHIDMNQLEGIFTRKITNWKVLGGTDAGIILAGREPTEAAYSIIKRDHPFFRHVKFDKVLTRDHQLVNFIKSNQGDYAISFGAQSNFDDEYLLHVEGFKTGVSLGLVYDTKNAGHPVVKAAIEFAKTKTWHKIVIDSGFLPPN